MRMWHIDMLEYLPTAQLLGQWRELFIIKKTIDDGASLSPLVSPLLMYPISHFKQYSACVYKALKNRGVNPDPNKLIELQSWYSERFNNVWIDCVIQHCFEGWHSDRYYLQCYFNLEEKYDRGMVTCEDWKRFTGGVQRRD